MHWLSASLDHRWPIYYSGRTNLCLARVNVLSAQSLVSEIIEKKQLFHDSLTKFSRAKVNFPFNIPPALNEPMETEKY